MRKSDVSSQIRKAIRDTLGLYDYTNLYHFVHDPETGERKKYSDKNADIRVEYKEHQWRAPCLSFTRFSSEEREEYNILVNMEGQRRYAPFIKKEYTYKKWRNKTKQNIELACGYTDARYITQKVIDEICEETRQSLTNPTKVFNNKQDILSGIYSRINEIILTGHRIANTLNHTDKLLTHDEVTFLFYGKVRTDSEDSQDKYRYLIRINKPHNQQMRIEHDEVVGNFDEIEYNSPDIYFTAGIYKNSEINLYTLYFTATVQNSILVSCKHEVTKVPDFTPVPITCMIGEEFTDTLQQLQCQLDEMKQTEELFLRQAMIIQKIENSQGTAKRLNI